jgi:hypothetical protein
MIKDFNIIFKNMQESLKTNYLQITFIMSILKYFNSKLIILLIAYNLFIIL